MTKNLAPADMLFLLAERENASMSPGGLHIFQIPKGAARDFVANYVAQLRNIPPRSPFNQTLNLRGGRPRMETTEVDMHRHVQHVKLPRPGNRQQLIKAVEQAGEPLLDRKYPLWKCTVFEGLQGRRFALLITMHHALSDGQGGLDTFHSLVSHEPGEPLRAFWGDNKKNAKAKKKSASARPPSSNLRKITNLLSPANQLKAAKVILSQSTGLAQDVIDIVAGEGDNLAQLRWFKGERSRFNMLAESSKRTFGYCDLPLGKVRRLGKQYNCTVNDVLLCLADAASNRYLSDHGEISHKPQVAIMPISTRVEGDETMSNNVTVTTLSLGQPDADITDRMKQIRTSTTRFKQLYAKHNKLTTLNTAMEGLATLLRSTIPGKPPNSVLGNMGFSNISPPKNSDTVSHAYYAGDAKLMGIYCQPILGGAVGLNITVLTYNKKIRIGVGGSPEALPDADLFARYMYDALLELESATAAK